MTNKLIALLLILALLIPSAASSQVVSGQPASSTTTSGAGSAPSLTGDPIAYGQALYEGTGAKGTYGHIDTTSTRHVGAVFMLSSLSAVAVMGSDIAADALTSRTYDGGKTWSATVSSAISGQVGNVGLCGPGVRGSASYYVPCGAEILKTDLTGTFIAIMVTGITNFTATAPSGMAVSSTRVHVVGTNTGAGATNANYCRSTNLNPGAGGDFTCQDFPAGGSGGNAGGVFRGESIAYVPGTSGTILVVDNPTTGGVANVYRSTDDGANWSFVTTVNEQGTDLVTNPQNPAGNSVKCHSSGNPCWIAAGSFIHKSTDAGATWTQVLSDTTNTTKYGIAVFDESPSIMVALYTGCTGNNQIMGMRTADGGTSFTGAFLDRCGVTAGRNYTNVQTSLGRIISGLVTQTPNLAFQSPVYGSATTSVGSTSGGVQPVGLYTPDGQFTGQKATYHSALTIETATAAGTGPFFSICGSATKTVRIKRIAINGSVATAATRSTIVLKKTSTATSAGTATTLTQGPLDSLNAAGSATLVNYYTVLATAGASVGVIGGITRTFPITATIAATDVIPQMVWDFTGLDLQPVTLRSTAECVEASFTATTTNAPTLWVGVMHTEE